MWTTNISVQCRTARTQMKCVKTPDEQDGGPDTWDLQENNRYKHLLASRHWLLWGLTGHYCLISPIPDEEAGAEPQLVHLMIRLRGFSQISGNEINLQCNVDMIRACPVLALVWFIGISDVILWVVPLEFVIRPTRVMIVIGVNT